MPVANVLDEAHAAEDRPEQGGQHHDAGREGKSLYVRVSNPAAPTMLGLHGVRSKTKISGETLLWMKKRGQRRLVHAPR